MKIYFVLIISMLISFCGISQEHGWHLEKADKVGSVAISAHELYTTHLKNMNSSEVIVAVIDSGIDVEHEDLQDNIWINTDEIPDNGKDDDRNGYIDDVYGWNFIGGKDGNVNDETLEVTRLYAKYKYKYENAVKSKLSKDELKEYELFLRCKEEVETNRKRAMDRLEQGKGSKDRVKTALSSLSKALDGNSATLANLQDIDASEDEALAMGKNIVLDQISRGDTLVDIAELEELIYESIDGSIDYFRGQAEYMYNPDFESRGIVGDNYADQTERYYGNNDVEGPDAFHGTHVAGIIGAVRDNDLGMDGVATNVKLMSVRTVPNGDERDKDVANAIRYLSLIHI